MGLSVQTIESQRECKKNGNAMLEIYDIVFKDYCKVVEHLINEFDIDVTTKAKEKKLFQPNKVLKPHNTLTCGTVKHRHSKPIERWKSKLDGTFYLKYSKELLVLLRDTKMSNPKNEYKVGGLWFSYPLVSSIELKRKIELEHLTPSQYKYYTKNKV